MKSTRNTLLIFFTLAFLALGCKKESDDDGSGTPTTPIPFNNGINEYEGVPINDECRVLFWSRLLALDRYDFYLEIDGQSVLFDNVYTSAGNGPQSCNSPNGTSFYFDPGTYTYQLRNTSMGVSTTGSITLEMGQCRIVEFVEPTNMWGKGKLLVYASNITGDRVYFYYEEEPAFYYNYLTQEFGTAPEAFTEGTYSRYLEPGTYQMKVFNGEGLPGALIDTFSFEVIAGQQTTLRLEEQ